MMGLSWQELAILAGVVVVLFAPGLIARRCRALGQTVAELRNIGGLSDDE